MLVAGMPMLLGGIFTFVAQSIAMATWAHKLIATVKHAYFCMFVATSVTVERNNIQSY